MRQEFFNLELKTNGQKLYEFTDQTIDWINKNNFNSNQQLRFITLIDIIYDKNIPIAVTASKNLNQLTSSKSLEQEFKRTISRLYELTSNEYN